MKIGRNDPCPCGSSLKYKKCHYPQKLASFAELSHEEMLFLQGKEIQDLEKKYQQGHGRGIISSYHNGVRYVFVKNRKYSDRDLPQKWKTFPDFLGYYMFHIFEPEFFKDITKKDFPLVKLLNYYNEKALNSMGSNTSGIHSMEMDNNITTLLYLIYGLYLLADNAELQQKLIKRLKTKDHFESHCYEVFVASLFIRSGFQIELYQEGDRGNTSPEYAVIHPNGKKFDVEVKNRHYNQEHLKIKSQINKAFKKDCKHERIIFININKGVPEGSHVYWWEEDIYQQLQSIQTEKSAHIFISNQLMRGKGFMQPVLNHFAINKQGFKFEYSLEDLLHIRDLYPEIFTFRKLMHQGVVLPQTFDGKNPLLLRNGIEESNLLPGKKIEFNNIKYTIQLCTYNNDTKKITCIVNDYENGFVKTFDRDPTDAEEKVLSEDPSALFGKKNNFTIDNPLEIYDWVYESYKNTSRKNLIEILALSKEKSKQYSTQELRKNLVKIYSENMIKSAIKDKI
jgi:hypothetical protein